MSVWGAAAYCSTQPSELRNPTPPRLADINVSILVDAEIVRTQQHVSILALCAAPTCKELAVESKDRDAPAPRPSRHLWEWLQFGDVYNVVTHTQSARIGEYPLLEEISLLVEYLQTVVLVIANEDAIPTVDPHIVNEGKLARTVTLPAPGKGQSAIGAEAVDLGIAVAIGDKDIAVAGNCEICRHVERSGPHDPAGAGRRW